MRRTPDTENRNGPLYVYPPRRGLLRCAPTSGRCNHCIRGPDTPPRGLRRTLSCYTTQSLDSKLTWRELPWFLCGMATGLSGGTLALGRKTNPESIVGHCGTPKRLPAGRPIRELITRHLSFPKEFLDLAKRRLNGKGVLSVEWQSGLTTGSRTCS